jgi:hypothetical protein
LSKNTIGFLNSHRRLAKKQLKPLEQSERN